MILAGFMRLTILNNAYTPTECIVTTKEIQEVRGVCVAGKCSKSQYYGRVEFKIPAGREIWTTVIDGYDKQTVTNYMSHHFSIGQETQCYISKDGHLIFQLHQTTVLLIISIFVLIMSSLGYFIYFCCIRSDKKKQASYEKIYDDAIKL
tara:strand:- start:41393 stop:41839 length:447 start_codon:yes stop_codon:yes gene_type:complete